MIMGYILLAGGAEFSGRMAIADRRAIELASGFEACIRIIPAAAAPDNNHRRAGRNGVSWFKKLGAVNVAALPPLQPGESVQVSRPAPAERGVLCTQSQRVRADSGWNRVDTRMSVAGAARCPCRARRR